MAFRDRLGKGLLTGALGGGRIGGALSGVGDILQESFGGLGSGFPVLFLTALTTLSTKMVAATPINRYNAIFI